MPAFEECCVLIPAATLEDFPSDLSDYDARSMLAAWTVLWHPQLLAATGQLPTWYRADSPPDPKPGCLIVAPAPSMAQLPADFQLRVEEAGDCHLVTGGSRSELLASILQIASDHEAAIPGDLPQLTDDGRPIAVDDFYAAGYASLQIQVMTRRLRYTSNLDEIHVQNRAVGAAESFLKGKAAESIAALHEVFDALAEERDHYFSASDPHLVDLTLVSPTTVDQMLDEVDASDSIKASDAVLATPRNFLIDQDVAEILNKSSNNRVGSFRQAIAESRLGWAGGGPSASICLDAMTVGAAHAAIAKATQECRQAIGSDPRVFARFTGGWSGDMNWALALLGYLGVIPIDFAAGTGHGDEAKVLLETGQRQIEALTAKPIDASSDAAFLSLGAKLGESIDGGEIATALFAHWPGQGCDSFSDVRRAATWSLCFGRFWKLDEYFSDGEHPYHHGNISAASKFSASLLELAVENEVCDPISSQATDFCDSVRQEQLDLVGGLADLVSGRKLVQDDPLEHFANAVVGNEAPSPPATMLINSASVGRRETLTCDHSVSADAKHVFACSQQGSTNEVTVDVPACGFVLLGSEGRSKPASKSLTQRLREKFSSGQRLIASMERSEGSGRLQNEFMEIVISPESGGVSGVYSGSIRGNRFSMKLVRHKSEVVGEPSETVMKCNSIKVDSSSPATGCVTATGTIGETDQDQSLANFTLKYQLDRGSRVLQVSGVLTPSDELSGSPWQNYFAARAAVSGEAAICRPMIRDKVHRRSSRNIVAPLGVVVDEAERQTMVATHGLAFHRIASDRFLDTLLHVNGESQGGFRLSYGFDVPTPVAMARSLIAPTMSLTVNAPANAAPLGWIIHSSPRTICVASLDVEKSSNGRLVARVRVVQTQPQPCKAVLRFLRDVESAATVDQACIGLATEPAHDVEDRPPLETDGDRVSVAMSAHGVTDLMVVFRDSDSA